MMAGDRRYFDEGAFQRECLDAAAEAATTFYDVVFAPGPAALARDDGGGGRDGNGGAPPPSSSSSSSPPLLLAADSGGVIRAFATASVAATWLTAREAEPSSEPVFAWRAHEAGAAVYRLAIVGAGGNNDGGGGLLVSAGDDGWVKGWRLSEIGEAALLAAQAREEQAQDQGRRRPASGARRRPASSASASAALALASPAPGAETDEHALLRPAFQVRLPPSLMAPARLLSSLQQHQQHHHHHHYPAAQALAVDGGGHGREPAAFCGASDGGLFALVGLAGGRAELLPFGGGGAAGGQGGVLALDVCPSTGVLASGGEDGVVRVWSDPRSGGGGGGGGGAQQQQQQRQHQQPVVSFAPSSSSATYVSSLKFSGGGGGWLVAGTGAGDVELYSLPARALARRSPAAAAAASSSAAPPPPAMVPQALLLRPGEILAAGTAPALVAHRFSLEPPSELARCEVATDSAFALASSGGGGGGALAVAGAGATIELLSAQFTRLGLLRPPPSSNAVVGAGAGVGAGAVASAAGVAVAAGFA